MRATSATRSISSAANVNRYRGMSSFCSTFNARRSSQRSVMVCSYQREDRAEAALFTGQTGVPEASQGAGLGDRGLGATQVADEVQHGVIGHGSSIVRLSLLR